VRGVTRTVVETKYDEECLTFYEKKCQTEFTKKCQKEPLEICIDFNHRECTPKSEPKCDIVY